MLLRNSERYIVRMVGIQREIDCHFCSLIEVKNLAGVSSTTRTRCIIFLIISAKSTSRISSKAMMGSGCSSQRSGSRCQRRGSSSLLRRRCSTTNSRSRSLSSVMLGRFCSGGDDILQEEEQVRYYMSMCCNNRHWFYEKKVSTPHTMLTLMRHITITFLLSTFFGSLSLGWWIIRE
jgi:hypothetical protein